MRSEAVKCLRGLIGALVLSVTSVAVANPHHSKPIVRADCKVVDVRLTPTADGEGSALQLRTTCPPDYGVRVAQQGKRLVVDLRGSAVGAVDEAITDSSGVVGGVLTQEFRHEGRPTARVLIQLLNNASYRIYPSPTGMRIVLRKADRTHAEAPEVAASGASAGVSAQNGALGDIATVRNIRFDRLGDTDRVVVDLAGHAPHSHVRHGPTRSVLSIEGAALASALERTFDVSAYGGDVRSISAYRARDGKRVMIDVDHADGVRGTVIRHGDAVHYVFSATPVHSSHTGIAVDGQAARTSKTIAGAPQEPLEWRSEPDRAAAFLPTKPLQQVGQRRRFTGRRIDLDLKDADIDNVLRLVADVGRINIVTADNVKGTVTIRMRNVPWDQALDTILQAKKLGMVRKGNIVRVALMADLNQERELAIARRKAELALEPIETRLIPISYASAVDLQQRAQEMLSPRGSIVVDERTNVLIARDVRGNLNQLEELIRALDTQTPQVLIEARIVEATSRYQHDVGIQWGGDVAFGPATGNETGLTFPSSVGVVGGASDAQAPTAGLSPINATVPNPNFAVNLPAAAGTGIGGALGLTLGSIDNTVNLAVRLSAAEATGMLRIVSSPRILTLDNHDARINQGTLIPFSQISAQGVQTVFQEAKLQLLVRPHVTADGSVSMHVKINRDEPDFNQTSARGDPTILKREAETDLLVRDGHTAVIGGIYTRNTGRNIDQVPLLGDIPILGVLFQRRRSSDSRSELVIFLTPRIVNRAESLGR